MKSMLVMLEKMYSSLNCDSVRGQRLTFSFGGRGGETRLVLSISTFTGKETIYVFKYFEWL